MSFCKQVVLALLAVELAFFCAFSISACTEADKTDPGNVMFVASKEFIDQAVKNIRVVQDPASGLCFAVTGAVVSPGHPVLQVVNVPCKAER